MKKEKGFTLIELLVVIAIIGILAGILFIAINPKERRDSAYDSRYKANIDSVRLVAADVFTNNSPSSYNNLDSNEKVIKLMSDMNNPELKFNSSSWAIKAELTNGKYYCRDSSGNVSEKLVQDISDYKCD